MPPKRKGPQPAYISDDETSSLPPTVNIPTTRFRVRDDGRLVSTTHNVQIVVDDVDSLHHIDEDMNNVFNSEFNDDISEAAPSFSSSFDAFAELAAIDPAYFDELDEVTLGPRKKRPSDNPLREWIKDVDVFLEEDIRWEGRGDYRSGNCCGRGCSDTGTLYRCEDCEGGELLCQRCMVDRHRTVPLHRVKEWNGSFFKSTTFKKLGLRIQLGHHMGQCCTNPQKAWNDAFVVLDVTGIHEVGVDFCNCESAQPHFIQLLRFRWFPGSTKNPRTAATFRLLKHFQLLSFESKASAFEFYSALARETENTGTEDLQDRYRVFMRMVRQYRYIKMLKRGGRGHDPGGAADTRPGECAVGCPACPHPGVNLPEGWQDAAPEQRFLYCLFLAIDANFRLKRKSVSSDMVDPSLVDGKAYFVQEHSFKVFLSEYGPKVIQEPSTCSNHNAVNAERSATGLAATGVGTIDCSRHDIKRPTSVGDLQKGERYVNMDYLFFNSLRHDDLTEIVVSYDIACQWSRNLWDRMADYPRWMHVDHEGRKTFHFLIPKFHLPAHIMACQTVFSFNFNRNVGRTDGEAPERGWSHINPIATSTREMGPGCRRDTLDDHFGAWNWKKSKLMGPSLLGKIKIAVVECGDHTFLHNQFVMGLNNPTLVLAWEEQLRKWEVDHSQPNPFEAAFKAVSQDAVKLQLAEKEAVDMREGKAYALHEEISASVMLTMGMDLELQQRRLSRDQVSLGQHATDDQKRKLQVRSNTLQRKIASWMDVQQLYMPSTRLARSRALENDSGGEERVEDTKLWLPSALASGYICDPRLQEMEYQLRKAQANDALNELRDALRLRSHLYIDKDRFQRGQRANTRSRTVIHRVQARVDFSAVTYQTARRSLFKLAKKLEYVGWDNEYPPLNAGDIRGMSDPDIDIRMRNKSGDAASALATIPSEGHRTVSWIWRRLGESVSLSGDGNLHENLRIEFCKSKARADRWKEEVQLLVEEMRRVIDYFGYQANTWESKAVDMGWSVMGIGSADIALREGRIAYAKEQSAQFLEMAQYCKHLWRFVPQYVRVGYGDVIPPEAIGAGEDEES